jgi:hypothetical protein
VVFSCSPSAILADVKGFRNIHNGNFRFLSNSPPAGR